MIAPVLVLNDVTPEAIVNDLSADKSSVVPLMVIVLVCGTLVPIEVAIVVAKLGSFPRAAANSFKVSNVAGEDATKLAI